MTTTKLKPAKNKFQTLLNDADDYAEEENEDRFEIKQPVLDPNSVLGQFVNFSKGAQKGVDIAKAIDRILKVNQTSRTYDNKFETYDSISPKEYSAILEGRIHCFDNKITEETLEMAYNTWKNLPCSNNPNELKEVLEFTIRQLGLKKPMGHGGLLLLGYILRKDMSLMKTDLLKTALVQNKVALHVLGWLIAYTTYLAEKPLPGRNLLLFFHHIFMNPDASFGPIAVSVAHCVKISFERLQDYRMRAKDYTLLIRLGKDQSSNRAKHISQLFADIIPKLQLEDPVNYAEWIIKTFSDMPKFRNETIINNCKNETLYKEVKWNILFAKGWLKFNEENQNGVKILQELTNQIPESIISLFPKEELNLESDIGQLQLKKDDLYRRSIRFIVVSSLAAAAAFGHYYLELF